MAAPELDFTISGSAVSSVNGFNYITVTFSSDIAYAAFECRATPKNSAYGRGVGKLIASFSQTPANTARSFDVYDTDLVSGEGDYRISLYAQSEDGDWNDNHGFAPAGADGIITADGQIILCER